MKKNICYVLLALSLSLCACEGSDKTVNGNTESGTPFVETSEAFGGNNQAESESGGSALGEDDGYNYLRELDPKVFTEDYIDYLKQSNSGISFDKWEVKAGGESNGKDGPVIYRGGEVEISFTATMQTEGRAWSNGYLVFVGGTPQLISLNGSEPSTLVIDQGEDGDTKEYSIRFTPRLTAENLADRDNLKLTLIQIDNPLYLTSGTVEQLDFEHRMTLASQRPFYPEGDCETTELVSGGSFALFPERDPAVSDCFQESMDELKEYNSVVFELCSATKEKPLIRDGKAEITLLLYGSCDPQTTSLYQVYFYVNHEPVKIDGCDYVTAELKEGLVAKYSTTLDNLKAGDVVYAIAVAKNNWSLGRRNEWAMKTDSRRLFAAE